MVEVFYGIKSVVLNKKNVYDVHTTLSYQN